MHPISNMKRMARFGALFGAMTLVTACSSALEGPKDRQDKSTTHTQDGDASSIIVISTSAPAWPSDPPPDYPSNPEPSSTGTSTGGGGGGGDPGGDPDPGCRDGFYVNGVCRHIGEACNANRAGAANCDCLQFREEGRLASCRYGADYANNPMIVYTCRGTSENPGGSHHGEADDDATPQHCN